MSDKRKISPLLIVGILMFVLPLLLPIVHIGSPKWIGTVGFILILVGAGHTWWINK